MGVSTSKEYKREWARKRMKDPAYRACEVERAITTPKGQR